MKLSLLVVLFSIMPGYAQVLLDTSYTINTVYAKEIKKYPQIKKVTYTVHDKVSILKDIPYKKIQNRNLGLDVFYLNDKNQHPGVVLIHGGGWKSGNKQQMHALAQEITLKGFSCICVEYRLANEAKYPAGIVDIKSAIHFAKQHAEEFKLMKDKIAVLGCSSGGQMAALIGTINGNALYQENAEQANSDVQAIINLDGILAFKHPESQEGKAASFWLDGSYEECPKKWREASALEHCDSKTPPVLFINSPHLRFHAGENDFIEKLNKNGIYYEVKSFTDSPHSFWFFYPWFDEIVNTSTQFLHKIFYNSTN
jgi:acetyl esterase/lipase